MAIGEIGLDYYWDKSPKEKQQSALEDQLNLADELDLPVIIHNRESHDDMLNTLEQWVKGHDDRRQSNAGVMHSFSAPPAYAKRAIQAGFYLGFTGPITFKKAEETRQIAKETPTDRLLIETDGPFLTPQPYRGKRNEPAYVQYVNDKIAELHDLSPAEMGHITTNNAIHMFNLPINR